MDTTKIRNAERDREATEERLTDAVGVIIAAEGFEALGVRRVAERAGVNKTLIYRYFGSLDGLIYAYMRRHDFWLKATGEEPDEEDIRGYIRAFYRRQIAEYRDNVALKRLRRWELSTDNELVTEIRAQRERNGVRFMEAMERFARVDKRRLHAITAIVDAGIAHLAMLEENCPVYNGVDIRSDAGWEQLAEGIDTLVDVIVKCPPSHAKRAGGNTLFTRFFNP